MKPFEKPCTIAGVLPQGPRGADAKKKRGKPTVNVSEAAVPPKDRVAEELES